jgi:hypothetical protein
MDTILYVYTVFHRGPPIGRADVRTHNRRGAIARSGRKGAPEERKNPAESRVLKVQPARCKPDDSRYRRHLCLSAIDR